MRRLSLLLSLLVVVLVGGLALHAQPVTLAQEATPSRGEEQMPEGFTYEQVMFASGIELSSPLELNVFRFGLEPGTALPVEDSPGVGVLVVESGSLTVEVDAEVMVTRRAGMSEAMATAEATGDFSGMMESVAEGEAVTLEAGDAAHIPGDVPGEIRNEGQESATALAFIVYPSERMMGEATPAP
jgi:quercetin dioxygenase-like cupin family protein